MESAIGMIQDQEPADYGQMMPSHAIQPKATDTRTFGKDKSAAAARSQLAPIAGMVEMFNPAEAIGNAAQAVGALTGDKKSQAKMEKLVAQAMRNLPISQGETSRGR